ncbi:MAG: LD-carboxypeptidase, partial [Firmicutes bacterium]|nr:LD-carboxypeptidase [Bacillota bacterium]
DGIGKSTDAKSCAAEIDRFFTQDLCDVIISCGGGETMCEDLSFVDFEAIKKAPAKWFMGYSDNTNLTFTLPVLCDTAAIYGPCASSFGMKPWHPAIGDAMALLQGKKLQLHNYDKWELEELDACEDPYAPYHTTEPFSMRAFGADGLEQKAGEESLDFSGRLLGGCLDVLVCLCGTRFDRVKEFNERYKKDGVIWFLESCELGPMGVRRALWTLKNAGWFDTAKGFVFGRPMEYHAEAFGADQQAAILSMVRDLGVPVILDADLGHLPPMMPIISGAMAAVQAKAHTLTIDQRLE